MMKKDVKRVMRKKRQLKKKAKRQQQQGQQQKVYQQIGIVFGHQQYGNADSMMQQLKNQNQTAIDKNNSMTPHLRSLKKENKKNEAMMSELTKQRKDAEHGNINAKIDLKIMDDKARNVETLMKQKERCIDKQQQIKNELIKQKGDYNRFKQINEIEE